MIHSMQYTQLEVFAISIKDKAGKVTVKGQNGAVMEQNAGSSYYRRLIFSLEQNTDYEIFLTDAKITWAYLSGNENLMEEGICYLDDNLENVGKDRLAEHYDTCYREQYHFVPFVNWMNDPNGLCWYQGNYHMFYQLNPHDQKWDNMYWGHAVSRDLLHWTHLPVVFEPQERILEHADEFVGGAFSGSAVVLEDEVLFYLTRHFELLQGSREVTETQTMTRSRDLLHFEPETTIIDTKPQGCTPDFRDPKLLKIGNIWYMVLGSAINGKAAILLYRSEDMEHWSYDSPLLIEQQNGVRCFECPDFYELDGKYVAAGAWMEHYDENGRYQMSRTYIGDWKDGKFEIQSSGWFDFGSNCYAMQSFEHEGRRICFGWVSDFYQEHVVIENGAYGSMTLPREMHVRKNVLCMEPVSEVYSLLDETICSEKGKEISISDIRGNSYFAKLVLNGDSDFRLLLGKDGEKEILLVRENQIVSLRTIGTASEKIGFPADAEAVRYIEIFVDRRVVEVYLNHGEAAGTKLFYNTKKEGVFELKAAKPEEFSQIEICTMKSIW
ncbi:MAG: glycoside hydrolase family 32 protein [Lachnospiraceae bacterium]|nr:glycoside hydrolase family 32 protein [Lachnospiraceae bacterium]